MRSFSTCFLLIVLFSCAAKQSISPKGDSIPEVPCKPGSDSTNTTIELSANTLQTPTATFYSIVDFIKRKGQFLPVLNKHKNLQLERETEKSFTIAYDSCNVEYVVTRKFQLKNMQVTQLAFASIKPDKATGFGTGFRFEEWSFVSDDERDSAMSVVRQAYNHPKNITAYDKLYSKFISTEKKIYVLEAGAAYLDCYVTKYKKLIESFLQQRSTHP